MPFKALFAKLGAKSKTHADLLAAINALIVEGPALTPDVEGLLRALGEARGLPMKVAQIVAFTDPRLPLHVREVLTALPWRAKPISEAALQRLFTEDFGAAPADLFGEFQSTPVAAASIGQVHRGRLHDGTEVAIKVQSPGIEAEILENFGDSQFVAQMLRCAGMNNVLLVDDICKTVLRECDYLLEASTQETIRTAFSSRSEMLIPRVHSQFSSRRILTMDWVEGKPWHEFRATATPEERSFAAQTISQFLAECAFKLRVNYADPHPGNFLFLPGRVAFLDFGRVRRFSPEALVEIRRLHELIMTGDREGARKYFTENSFFHLNNPSDFETVWAAALAITRHLRASDEVQFQSDALQTHRHALAEAAHLDSISFTADFFWAVLFTHTLIIAGRVDLEAAGDWRGVLKDGGV